MSQELVITLGDEEYRMAEELLEALRGINRQIALRPPTAVDLAYLKDLLSQAGSELEHRLADLSHIAATLEYVNASTDAEANKLDEIDQILLPLASHNFHSPIAGRITDVLRPEGE